MPTSSVGEVFGSANIYTLVGVFIHVKNKVNPGASILGVQLGEAWSVPCATLSKRATVTGKPSSATSDPALLKVTMTISVALLWPKESY
jgi:hypothetical protein